MVSERSKRKQYLYNRSRGIELFVPSGPVRDKIIEIVTTYDISMPDLARQTGVTYHKIRGVYLQHAGRWQKFRTVDAAKIMAWKPGPEYLTRDERNLGAQRILQGLMRKGFTSRSIADVCAAGWHTLDNWRIANSVQVPDQRSYWHLLGAARKLESVDPYDLIPRRGSVEQVMKRAESQGYVPLVMWDLETVHKAESFPDWTGKCGTAFGYQEHRRMRMFPTCEPCLKARSVYRAQLERKAANDVG